jgi:hypothetical protein
MLEEEEPDDEMDGIIEEIEDDMEYEVKGGE